MGHTRPGSASVRTMAMDLADAILAMFDGRPHAADDALAETIAHVADPSWWVTAATAADLDPDLVSGPKGVPIRQATLTCLSDVEANPDPFAGFG